MTTLNQVTPIPISDLPDATTLTGNEATAIVQNNQTVQTPINALPQGMTAGVVVYGNTGGTPFPNYRTLKAGSNISISDSGVQGDLTISSDTAPTNASYVVISSTSSLSAERVLTAGSGITITDGGANGNVTITSTAGEGTLTSVSVASANGFAGSSSGGTTPALTLSTSINAPILSGNGTAIAAATTTGTGSTAVLATSPVLITPNLGTPTALVGTNISGSAANLTSGIANAIASATTTVNVSSATAPTNGQVLTATGASAATWQSPSGGSSAFSALTSSTNTTAAMVVGTGATLSASGSGTITATAAPASGLTGATLASGVTGSSLTGTGTLVSGATGTGFTIALGASTITGILGSANGGTANGFTKFSGPASTEKTFTLPNASSSIAILGANTFTALQTLTPASGIAEYVTAGAIETAVYANGNSGTSFALNLDNGNLQSLTISGAVAITQTTPTHAGKYTVVVTQNGTGYTYSLSGIKWVGGVAPVYSTAANKVDIFSIIYDGSSYYGMGGIAFA